MRRCLIVILLLLLTLTACDGQTESIDTPPRYVGMTYSCLRYSDTQLLRQERIDNGQSFLLYDMTTDTHTFLGTIEDGVFNRRGNILMATDGDAIWLAEPPMHRERLLRLHCYKDGTWETRETEIALTRLLRFFWHDGVLLLDFEEYELFSYDSDPVQCSTRRVIAYNWETGKYRELFSNARPDGLDTKYWGYNLSAAYHGNVYISDPEAKKTYVYDLRTRRKEVFLDDYLMSMYVWDGKLYAFASDGSEIAPSPRRSDAPVYLCCYDLTTGQRLWTEERLDISNWQWLQCDCLTYEDGVLYCVQPNEAHQISLWGSIVKYDLMSREMEEIPLVFPEDGLEYGDFADLTVCGDKLVCNVGQGIRAILTDLPKYRAQGWAYVPLTGGTAVFYPTDD